MSKPLEKKKLTLAEDFMARARVLHHWQFPLSRKVTVEITFTCSEPLGYRHLSNLVSYIGLAKMCFGKDEVIKVVKEETKDGSALEKDDQRGM